MPLKDKEAKRIADRERLRTKRGATNGDDIPRGDTDGATFEGYPEGYVPLYPRSKFLSLEEDMRVQENVKEAVLKMSGSRLQAYRGLSNVFTPSIVKNPSLIIPEV